MSQAAHRDQVFAIGRNADDQPPAVLADLVDTGGIAFAAVFTDAAGGHPEADADDIVHVAERACGEALNAFLARRSRDLLQRLAAPDEFPIACSEQTCVVTGAGEWDLTTMYRFAGSADTPRLIEVQAIETPMVPTELREEWWEWTRREVARLATAQCTRSEEGERGLER